MSLRLPKNIRQIGNPDTKDRLYIEDYVITFMRQIANEYSENNTIFIFVGKNQDISEIEGLECTFVYGVIRIEVNEHFEGYFSNEIQRQITEKISKYFDDGKILGWGIMSGEFFEIDQRINKISEVNFCDDKSIFLMYDYNEKYEYIYRRTDGILKREHGFFIYYDRNEQMQNYMLEERGNKSIEQGYSDEVTKKIVAATNRESYGKDRKVTKKKNVKKKQLIKNSYMLTILVVSLTLAGITKKIDIKNVINNIDFRKTLHLVNNISEDNNGKNKMFDIDKLVEVMNEHKSLPKEKVETAMSGEDNMVYDEIKDEDFFDMKEITFDKTEESDENLLEDQIENNEEEIAETTEEKVINEDIDDKERSYTVSKGDSLVSISRKMYGNAENVNTIIEANNIEDENKIYIGQVLRIP
ncbi:MAG: LysM peptidoglycan-binding domain-containing protein [Lachnospiraceae bacterium]|nr:LysM peptidoglycan-binding domain-containing protein [Lachnospiraceae bacterium]